MKNNEVKEQPKKLIEEDSKKYFKKSFRDNNEK
jgi:hypothetical protein